MDPTTLAIPLLSFVAGLATCRAARSWALRRGFVDQPGERKIHDRPIPYGGGIGLVAAMLVPVALGAAAALFPGLAGPWLPDSLSTHLPGMREKLGDLAFVMGGGLVVFALGHFDDRRKLAPSVKFAVEIAVAIVLVLKGIRFTLFFGDSTLGAWAAGAVTVLWITGITNAMNFLDNMDGLCAGIATIAATLFTIIALQSGQLFIAFLLLALVGACLAFLCWNFPPASMFLGDSGSLFVGYCLAVLTVLFTFYEYHEGSAIPSFCVPFLVLAVPLHDALTVIAIRLRVGHPIWVGDNRHLSHRLVQLGFSRRGAVLLIYLLTLITGLGGTLIYRTTIAGAVTVVLQAVLVLLALSLIESTGRRRG